jgi:hypothetical protein
MLAVHEPPGPIALEVDVVDAPRRPHREPRVAHAPGVVDADRVPDRPHVVVVERDGLPIHDQQVVLDPEERALEPVGVADVTPHRVQRKVAEHTSMLPHIVM